MTSVSQWTPRRARLAATDTAISAAMSGEHGADGLVTISAEHEGDRRPSGGGATRVTGREGIAAGDDEVQHHRALPADDLLQHVVEQQLADTDRGDEGEHLSASPADVVGHRGQEQRRGDDEGAPQLQ